MAASLIQLTAPLDKATVLADLYTLGGYFGLPVPAMQVGEPIPTVLAKVVEWFVDDLWNPNVVPALRAPFLDWATGDWLTLIAALIYNRPRIGAQSGTGPIKVENRSAVSGTVAISVGSIRVKNKDTGATYTNTTASSVLQWTGSGAYPQAIPVMTFEADVVGSASNALLAPTPQIASFPTPPTTSPSVGLYALPNESAILGSDEETDERLVVRCRVSVQSVGANGPRGAYYDAATNPVAAFTSRNQVPPPAWGSYVPANTRIRIQEPGSSVVLVWIASNSGPAGGDNTDPNSDVGMADVAIHMWCVPPGATCTVAPALRQDLALGSIVLDVSAESRVTTAEAIATATAAYDEFFRLLPIGGARDIASPTQGYVFYKRLAGVLTAGAGVQNVTISGLTVGVDTPVGGNAVVVPSITGTITANVVTQGA